MVQRILPEGIEGLRILIIILLIKMHFIYVNAPYYLLLFVIIEEEEEEDNHSQSPERLSEICAVSCCLFSTCFVLVHPPSAAISLCENHQEEDCAHGADSSPETQDSTQDCLELL